MSELLDDTFFKDHAVLAGVFTSLGSPPLMPMWKQPMPIDWKAVPELSEVDVALSGSPDDQYGQIVDALESKVDHARRLHEKSGLHPKQRGRAATHEVHWVSEYSSPPKHARQGERQPTFQGVDATHALWLRQVWRVSILCSMLVKNQTCPQNMPIACGIV